MAVGPPSSAQAALELLGDGQVEAAKALVGRALETAPRNAALLSAAATVADHSGNLDVALRHWETLRCADPAAAAGYVGALRTLRRFNRLDLTAPILDAGMAQIGSDADFIVMAAQVAVAAKQYERGVSLWQRAVALRPGSPNLAVSAALAHIGPRTGRAQRMPRVLALLDALHARFPNYVPAYTAHIEALREVRRDEEAGALAVAWCERFPNDLKLALARAALHEDAGRPDCALHDIVAIRGRIVGSAKLEAAYIRALSCAGQFNAADRVCATARRTYPKDRRILIEYANIASRQANWQACVARLHQAQQILPRDEGIARQMQTALLQLAELPDPAVTVQQGRADRQGSADTVFARFESLGGSGMGCEFGMVQRRMGSDSVGLLRWARTNPAEMIAGINCGFEGVGDQAHTELRAVRVNAGREEYVTRDRRFMMEAHTFVSTSDAPFERMYEQTCRRLRFLRGRLLEEIAAGEKIFVYRCEDAVEDAVVVAMHAALARFGDTALLCVMRARNTQGGGRLRTLGRGVFIGYVSHFALDQSGFNGSDVSGWTAICAQADAQWRAREAAQGGS